MKITLGDGYWIDASDGMNWTLYKGVTKNPRKNPRPLGYHSNLRNALEAAVRLGCHADGAIEAMDRLDARLTAVADAILGQVEVTTERVQEMGVVKRFRKKVA